MEQLKIAMVARELGITSAGVYKRLKKSYQLVGNHIVKENGIIYLTRQGVEILREAIRKSEFIRPSTGIQPVEGLETKHLKEIIANQQHTIDSLIAQNEEQRKRTDSIIMKLTHDVGNLQKAIEYRQTETKAPKAESLRSREDEVSPDPRLAEIQKPAMKPVKKTFKEMNFLQRFWFELFAPEKMRQFEP